MVRIAKKIFSALGSALIVLIVSGFISLQPISVGPAQAHHDDADSCIDITKTQDLTTAILSGTAAGRRGGIADSGQLNFDFPAHDYQACVRSSVVDGEHKVDGWTWNTNLGLVSFSCTGGDNLDGGCGNYDYGVSLTSDNRVRGFAWGDNIGWISMGCDSNGQNTSRGSGVVPCGSLQYGVSVAQDGDTDATCPSLNAGDLHGFAWAKSVGWMNFCGAAIDPAGLSLLSSGTYTAEVSFGYSSDPVFANGVDYRSINVVIRNADGSTPDLSGYELVPTLDSSITNTVRTDQVTSACSDAATAGCSAVTIGNFTWDGSKFVSQIKSVAPTNSDNVLQIDSMTLALRVAASGVTEQAFSFDSTNAALPKSFTFEAPLQVSEIASPDASGNFEADTLGLTANSSQEVRIRGGRNTEAGIPANADITLVSQVYDCRPTDEYSFVFDEEGTGDAGTNAAGIVDDAPSTGTFSTIRPSSICGSGELQDVDETTLDTLYTQSPPGLTRYIFASLIAGRTRTIERTQALAYQTLFSYVMSTDLGPVNVRYFARSVSDGSVRNQSALVRGDISNYIRNISELPDVSRIRQSLGQNAQSKREIYYRAIKKVIGNRTSDAWDTGNKKILNEAALARTSANKGILYYKCPSTATSPCSVILDDADGNLNLSANITLVTLGADVFIDSNISGTGRLAIVALEDLAVRGTRKGGYGYLCSRVTDINLNAVFDNSLLPYGVSSTSCDSDNDRGDRVGTDAIPVLGSESMCSTFKNQLAWKGSLTADNTYGGSMANPPLNGDGGIARTSAEMARARWYDVNFMRCANVEMFDPPGPPPPRSCWSNTIELSRTIPNMPAAYTGPGDDGNNSYRPLICSTNNPVSYGMVNFFFSPAPKDQPVVNVATGQ